MQVAKSHVQTRNYSLWLLLHTFSHFNLNYWISFFIGTIVYDGGGSNSKSRHNKQFFVPPCVFHEWIRVYRKCFHHHHDRRRRRCNNNNNCGLLALNMVDWIMKREEILRQCSLLPLHFIMI